MSLILFILFTVQSDQPLSEVVESYCRALYGRDKATALQYVHPDDLNNFLGRNPIQVVDWKLKSAEEESETSGISTVTVQQLLLDGAVMEFDLVEHWIKLESGWKLRVASPQERFRQMYSPAKQELLEQLDIPTRTVRFYVIAPQQPGSFLIRNGLYDPVTITSLEYDRSKFELITELVDLDPRTSKRIYFNYIGQEKEYNQTEVLRVTLKHGNQKEKFELPIVYNHFDATTRWLIQQGRVPVPNPNQ